MINYAHLATAIKFYEFYGFKLIEAPWAVSDHAVWITAPSGATLYPLDNKYLVASGEQSFLELMLTNKLPKERGRWACVTPCFRDDIEDKYHQKYFMKLELIATRDTTISNLEGITQTCLEFFCSYIPGCSVLQTDPSDPLLLHKSARDILSPQGVELGSYGIRKHPEIGEWIYATGCAEPRLSIAMQDYRPI